VRDYLDGGNWTLLDEFVEVESGKRNHRPEPEKALTACKKHRAKLVIAKLDRLSRSLVLIAMLMDRKVDFVCATIRPPPSSRSTSSPPSPSMSAMRSRRAPRPRSPPPRPRARSSAASDRRACRGRAARRSLRRPTWPARAAAGELNRRGVERQAVARNADHSLARSDSACDLDQRVGLPAN
jgi:DNA invertase Pin-like site-specific DNA recombinase